MGFGWSWWVFSFREDVLPGGSPPGRLSSREDFLNVSQLDVFVGISQENRLFQIGKVFGRNQAPGVPETDSSQKTM